MTGAFTRTLFTGAQDRSFCSALICQLAIIVLHQSHRWRLPPLAFARSQTASVETDDGYPTQKPPQATTDGINTMDISFDPEKRRATLDARGVDFLDAVKVFNSDTITRTDERFDYGESRYQTMGLLADDIVMVVWTPRGDTRHIISMRKCNDREKRKYHEAMD